MESSESIYKQFNLNNQNDIFYSSRMLNTQGYSKLPIIITGNKNATHGQGMMLQLNPTSNGTFLLNSQGQQLKVQGNILTQVRFFETFIFCKITFF